MRTRIEDVAAAADVSMKTVSRVLNDEPNVADSTRKRVEETMERLGYRPSQSARVLAGRRSYLVGLLYDNPSKSYVMEVQLGALEACLERHYHLMMLPLDYRAEGIEGRLRDLLDQTRVDGVLLTPPLTDLSAVIDTLDALSLPFASLSAREENQRIGVMVDERAAAREMVAHLVSLGHRRIGHITGHPAHGASTWRLSGYREQMAASGLEIHPDWIVDGEFSFESGRVAAWRLLDSLTPPTAIFAANDDMAAGAISAIFERGFSVPSDVSVCGYDDTPIARHIHPTLTTVCQPSNEMGRVAATELLRAVRSPGAGSLVTIPYALKMRQSTSAPPGV